MFSFNLQKDLANIDIYIAEQKANIKLGEALARLKSNPDFISVVLDGYIDAEATRLFNILIEPTGASPISLEMIQLKLAAISHFKQYIGTDKYLGTINMAAMSAPLNIIREEDERKRVTEEFANKDYN